MIWKMGVNSNSKEEMENRKNLEGKIEERQMNCVFHQPKQCGQAEGFEGNILMEEY